MGHRREAVDIEELVLECNFFCVVHIANLYSGDDCDNTNTDYYVYERNDQNSCEVRSPTIDVGIVDTLIFLWQNSSGCNLFPYVTPKVVPLPIFVVG